MSSDLIDKLRREFPSQQHAEAVNVSQDRHVSDSVAFNEPSLTGQWSRKKHPFMSYGKIDRRREIVRSEFKYGKWYNTNA